MGKPKFATNSAEISTSNGDITFIAARNEVNLNGYKYDVRSLQAQDATGKYNTLSETSTDVAIPLMLNHSDNITDKVGNIDTAVIETEDGIDQVVMHANFFGTDEAQQARQRILDGELTDVSITTDWGDSMDGENLENAHIVEVSIVYAGAEPRAKILAKNSVELVDKPEAEKTEADKQVEEEKIDEALKDAEAEGKGETTEQDVETADEVESQDDKAENDESENTEESDEEEQSTEDDEKVTNNKDDSEESEKETEMPTQKTQDAGAAEATKGQVLNALSKLASNGAIRKMNRSEVEKAVSNEITLLGDDSKPYVVPDSVWTEIFSDVRDTDILDTFAQLPVRRFTLMGEVPSDSNLARAGRWSKGQKKAIQESDLAAQKFATQFLYKMQEISYEDMQDDFGDVLLAYIRNELPQKVAEEEERDFIVGDGRAANNNRHISSIVSLDAAAEDSANVHVAKYVAPAGTSLTQAVVEGVAKIEAEGTTYAVMSKATLGKLRGAGFSTAAGLPFSVETVAGALGVDKVFTRNYVADDTVYAYVGQNVKRLTGASDGKTIEQYDIDYNNQKIEYIRPVGGGAAGLYSGVKVTVAPKD